MNENPKPPSIFQRALQTTRAFMTKLFRDWVFNFSAMLAYYLLVGLIPLTVAIFGIVGLVLSGDPAKEKSFVDALMDVIPGGHGNSNQSVTRDIINGALAQLTQEAGALLAVGIVVAILGAAQFFVAIDRAITVIYRIPDRSILRRNLMGMGMVIILVILVIAMVVANAAPSLFQSGIPNKTQRFWLYVAGIVLSIIAAFILFELIYLLVPHKKMKFRATWCGALIAACLLELVAGWFPYYIQHYTDSYIGAAGLIIYAILLLYYLCFVLLFGAEINSFCFEHQDPLYAPLATVLSEHYYKNDDVASRKPLIDQNSDVTSLLYQ